MSLFASSVTGYLSALRNRLSDDEASRRLVSRRGAPSPTLRTRKRSSQKSVQALWRAMRATGVCAASQEILTGSLDDEAIATSGAAIENLIGLTKVPLGVVGPIHINGLHAHGAFYAPLATTEAALVASYARGAATTNDAGGIATALLYEGVIRAPAFVFDDIGSAGAFVAWVVDRQDALRAAAEATTQYGRLTALEPVIDGDIVFLRCRFSTGDAAGQNMATIATDALARHIVAHTPIPPRRWYVEGNLSSDKKATYLGFITGRGRKVTASVTIPGQLVEKRLRIGVDALLEYIHVAELGARLSGQIGAQGHVANGLAAMYLATGQDVACVSESAIGSTRFEARGQDLHVCLTLPNLLVGTVGGGTGLPSQSAALDIMGLRGPDTANALAEVAAALCVCGELSITAAIAAGHFTRAHRKLARDRK